MSKQLLSPQPDYNYLSQLQNDLSKAHQSLSKTHQSLNGEVAKIPNALYLQAVEALTATFNTKFDQVIKGIDGLHERINGLHGQIDGLHRRVDGIAQQVGEIKTELHDLKAEVRASNQNTTARINNSLLLTTSDQLSALVNPITHKEIQGFPSTTKDLMGMSREQLDGMLGQLGLDTHGDKMRKQERLKTHIGLRANPV